MATKEVSARIKQFSQTSAEWSSANPLLLQGEMGHESDTGRFKIGTGELSWNSLPYCQADWNATSGSNMILNRPDIVIVPCSDTYDGTANVFRLTKDCPSQPLGNKFTVLFVPSHDYVSGATFLLDGESYGAVYDDDTPGVVDGTFKAGLCISLDFQKMDGGGVTKHSVAIFNNGLSRDSLLLGGHPPEYYLSNPNLLINGDFQVWQNGTYITASQQRIYTADRWKAGSDEGAVAVEHSDGLLMTCTKAGWILIAQLVLMAETNLRGQTVTLAADCQSNLDNVTLHLYTANAANIITDAGAVPVSRPLIVTVPADTKLMEYHINVSAQAGDFIRLRHAKLEIGPFFTGYSTTTSALELLKCQRYYQVHSRGDIPAEELSPPMRINPRVSQRPDGLWAYDAEV